MLKIYKFGFRELVIASVHFGSQVWIGNDSPGFCGSPGLAAISSATTPLVCYAPGNYLRKFPLSSTLSFVNPEICENITLCLIRVGRLPLVQRKTWMLATSSRHTRPQSYFMCSRLKTTRVALEGKLSRVTATGPKAVKWRTLIFLPSPWVSFYH